MLVPQQDLNNTEKLQWTNKHVPASVSICSNAPEYTEPVCLISNGNPHELVEQMVEYLETISAAAMANLMEDPDMQAVFESIEQKLDNEENEEEEEEEEEEVRRSFDPASSGRLQFRQVRHQYAKRIPDADSRP